MRDLPLNALRAFAAVCETGGVRPAARSLEVTHSAVSRHLRELEAWLQVPLVEKREGSRSLTLTPQGDAFGKAVLSGLRELTAAAAALREARPGNAVTISTTPSFAARWLLPRLSSLAAEHPWIELSVIVDQRLAEPSEAGADLALRMGRGPWAGLACQPLMDDMLYPVMSRDLWEASGRPATPDALAGLRLLHDRDPHASWEVWRTAHQMTALDVRAGPRFASSDLVLRAASQGLGVALARHRLAAADIRAGVLVRPFGDLHVALPQGYWIVHSRRRSGRVAVAAVIDWLRAQASFDVPQVAPSGSSDGSS